MLYSAALKLSTLISSWAIVCLVVLVWHPNETTAQERLSGTTFGDSVTYNVSIYNVPQTLSRDDLKSTIDKTLAKINSLMSTYVPDSDVSRFNRTESTDWMRVDQETLLVVERAIEISAKTDGAFDITVGPLVNIWNFGPGKNDSFTIPDMLTVVEARQKTGYEKLSIRLNPPSLRKTIPGLQIDLSAIAKGYAVDRVAGKLRELGCQSFMVEIGGEVWVEKRKPDGGKWGVGINDPSATLSSRSFAVAALEHQAMATSGDYRNAHWIEGKRYSHTIDPKTGKPVTHDLASSSVVASDCLTADAYATAAMVLGSEKSIEMAESWGVEIYNLSRQSAGQRDEFLVAATVQFPIKAFDTKRPTFNWSIIVITFVVFLIAVIGMSVGVIFSNRRIKGSCGGIASLQESHGESIACSMCSDPSDQCKELKDAMARKEESQEP